MRLLVITQKVNKNDSDLGFFHAWLEKLAARVDKLIVICLQEGTYDLPPNVKVFSLGKQTTNIIHNSLFIIHDSLLMRRVHYIWCFYRLLWKLRRRYDAVFIHMNPEYAILGGPMWRLAGKKVLLWYTHKAVNWRLRLAEKFATKIFTASKESFRLPSRKAEIVGHGIDIAAIPVMEEASGEVRLLSVGRISPSKDIETIILAAAELLRGQLFSPPACLASGSSRRTRGEALAEVVAEAGWGGGSARRVSLDIIGEPVMEIDREYQKTLQGLVAKLGLQDAVHFLGGMPHGVLLQEYAKHHIFIHTSKTGSMDKVVLEAIAAGLHVVSSSESYGEFGGLLRHFPANDSKKLAECIEKVMENGILQPNLEGREFVKKNFDLDNLAQKIINFLSTTPGPSFPRRGNN